MPKALDAAAIALEVDGYLERHRGCYDLERTVRAWRRAETSWMTERGKKRRVQRPADGTGGTFALRLLDESRTIAADAASWTSLAIVTMVIVGIAARTIVIWGAGHRRGL